MAAQNTKNFSLKRRAIFTGLHPFLEMGNLLQAMVLWEHRYAGNPSFAVQHFVKEICITNQIESIRREILLSLVKAMGLPENQLLADPSEEIAQCRTKNNISSTAEYTSKELLVFQKLVVALLSQITTDNRVSVKEFTLLQVQRNPSIDQTLKRQFNLWTSKQIAAMKVPTPEIESLRKIIHFMYVGLCEYFGPIEADKLLSNATAKITNNETNSNALILRKLL